MATVTFHHSHPALCGSPGRGWASAKNWPGVPVENRCKRCTVIADSFPAPAPPPGAVTITDQERVIWSGTFADFQRANLDSLSVSEFCVLDQEGSILIGGGAAPLLMVSVTHERDDSAGANPKTINLAAH